MTCSHDHIDATTEPDLASSPVLGSPMATPDLEEDVNVDVLTAANIPWVCIVWDDPVNLMSYVTYVFQTVLGYSRKRAQELMMQVHTEGKAVVSTGERDRIEGDVKKLQVAGLWATMQQAG
ncbi:ATP-dependent Clp protease adapter ClpS [Corynebacterium caspium]|uniref:ATP-dependent Clp protease adapter ClpS n=1 Tax=Corynebacterium caspium TaxID=234828 RepID=UPI00037342BB|nr:ATP-dependent Clp protease adapter ClpS [Corynebacterium caspium]